MAESTTKKKSTKKTSKPKSDKVIEKNIEAKIEKCFSGKCTTMNGCNSGGCVYFLGFIGAAWYYITTTTGFWVGVWGVIKALVWPAVLVFKLFQFLGI